MASLNCLLSDNFQITKKPQRKAAHPHISAAGTNSCLAFLLNKWQFLKSLNTNNYFSNIWLNYFRPKPSTSRLLPVTELGKVLAFFRCSRRSNRPRRLSGLLASSGVWGLEEGLVLPLPLLSVGLTSVTCRRDEWLCERKNTARLCECQTKYWKVDKEAMWAHTLSLACFSASLASLWLRRSSRFCCCSLKPFCFCRASVIHKGPASFSWTLALSSECLLCSDGFSAREHVHIGILLGRDTVWTFLIIVPIWHQIFRINIKMIKLILEI